MAGAGHRPERSDDEDGTKTSNGRAAEPAGPYAADENGGSWQHQQLHQLLTRPSDAVPMEMAERQQQVLVAMAQQQQWLWQHLQYSQQHQQQQQQQQHGGVPAATTAPPYPYPFPPMTPAWAMPPGEMRHLSPQQMAAMMPYPQHHMPHHMPYMMMPGTWPMAFPPAGPPVDTYAASSRHVAGPAGSSSAQRIEDGAAELPPAGTASAVGEDSRHGTEVEITDVTNVDERPLLERAAAWYLCKLSFLASAYLGLCLYALGLAMYMADMATRLITRYARLAVRAAAAISAAQDNDSSSGGSGGSSGSSGRDALAPLLEMPLELRKGEAESAAQSVARALARRQGPDGSSSSMELVWMSPQQWQQGRQRRQEQQVQGQQGRQGQQEEEQEQDVLPWPYHELSDSLAVMTGLWFGVWLRVLRTMGWQLPLAAARSVALVGLVQLRTATWVFFIAARATFALVMTTYVSVPTRDLAPVVGVAARAVDTGRRAASTALSFVSRTSERLSLSISSSSAGGAAFEPRAVVGAAAAALQHMLAALLSALETAVSGLVGLRRRVLDSGVQVVPLAALLASAGARAAAMAGAAAGRAVGLAEAAATWLVERLSSGAPAVARQMLVTYLSFLFAMARRLGEESARMVVQLAALMWEHGGSGLLAGRR